MDARLLIELVQQAQAEEMDYYRLAALIAAEQAECDAKLCETAGAPNVANMIRSGA